MIRTLRTTAAAATVAATAVLSFAAAAQADVARHADRRHDVQQYDARGGRAPAPRVANPDITRIVVRHGEHRVTIRMTARQVTRTTLAGVADIRTPHHRYELLAMFDKDAAILYRSEDRAVVRCDGITTTRRTGRDVLVMSVPRRCVGSPRWVRAGAAAYSSHNDLMAGHFDDAFGGRRAGGEHLGLSRRL